MGGIERLQFGAQTGEQLSGAEAEGRFTLAPTGQAGQAGCGVEAKALDGSNQEHGIRGNVKSGLTRYGLFGPDLSLADAKQILFVLLIDFNFPSVKVGLQDLNEVGVGIGHQQVCRIAIEKMAVSAISQRCNDDQTQRPSLSATTPEQGADGLVRQLMATASGKDGGVLPRDGVIFAHLFGSCEILTVSGTTPPARWSFRQSGKTNV